MEKIISDHQEDFDRAIEFFKKDIQGLRTNRANPELVAHILIEVYGTKTPLEQLATLNNPEPRTIVIQPWDKTILKQIEQALNKIDLGANPIINEGLIRLSFPPLNEERRKSLIKILREKMENAKKSLRIVRDKIRDEIVKAEREKEISEDEKYRLFNELDKIAVEFQEKVKTIGEKKEQEISVI